MPQGRCYTGGVFAVFNLKERGAMHMYTIRYAAVTNPGKRHGDNEDNFYANGMIRHNVATASLCAQGNTDEESCVFAVCDGMGGYANGELASLLAIEAVVDTVKTCKEKKRSLFEQNTEQEAPKFFVNEANERICQLNEQKREESGSTIALLECRGDTYTIANVGDSRIYRFRDGKLEQLSIDHTVVARLIASRQISKDEAKKHPRAHQLTQYLGINPEEMRIQPAMLRGPMKDNDCYLLCSDGLTDMVADDQIERILKGEIEKEGEEKGNNAKENEGKERRARKSDTKESKTKEKLKEITPREIAQELCKAALEGGGRDNITVVVVQLKKKEEPAGRESIWKRIWKKGAKNV